MISGIDSKSQDRVASGKLNEHIDQSGHVIVYLSLTFTDALIVEEQTRS